jgi:uncharacterized protein (DUF362 family)
MNPIVSISRVGGVEESLKEIVKLAGGIGVKKGDEVVIKPNAKSPYPAGYGVVTDPKVIEPLIKIVLRAGAKKVMIADGAAMSCNYDSMAAFETIGYTDLASNYEVDLVDLNSNDNVTVDVPGSLILDSVRVGRSVVEADLVINVPVVKTHKWTLLSVCVKNMGVGCATKEEKNRLHQLGIHKALVDVYSVVKPSFNIVDGTIALEGDGPNIPAGKAKPLGVLMAGKDGVAVDAVCAMIMGVRPTRVKHLRLAEKQGLGVIDLNRINLKGEKIDRVITNFELPSAFK